jgi:P-type Ca2+ transporter type 2C
VIVATMNTAKTASSVRTMAVCARSTMREALTPLIVLYLLFFATAVGVVIIAVDPGDPEIMRRRPRDPKLPITNRAAVTSWVLYAFTLFVAALVPLVAGPDDPRPDAASVSMTMTFAVMGFGTAFNALTNRRDSASGLTPPILKALAIALVTMAMLVLAAELPAL